MPLYEYLCDACGHRFELIQKFSDSPVETCPKCSGTVKKLLSSPAIQFKGSGWYITDYARAGKADGATTPPGKTEAGGGAAAETKSTSADKSESKSDTKPAPDSKSASS